MIHIEDEIALRSSGMDVHVADAEKQAVKTLVETQKALANAMLEKNEAVEDRAHLFEMLGVLKEKYLTLMDEKVLQSEDLVAKEDDLMVSFSLFSFGCSVPFSFRCFVASLLRCFVASLLLDAFTAWSISPIHSIHNTFFNHRPHSL